MMRILLRFMLLGSLLTKILAQFAGSSSRTQQELNLLNWATGIRMAYCQATPVAELIDPFKEAVARMINRFCRNATACRLKKPVTFTKYQIVVLDGYPRRENRALNFRFFVVFPHDAIPIDKRLEKPLITQKTLSDILKTQISELTHGLGWQVLSYERYPRFDPMTTFMNHTLVFILPISFLCMLFLAYWSSTITSGSSLYSGDGWMVSGSTGGKNAALRRTLEIIEEQKYRFDAAQRHSLYGVNSAVNTKSPTTVVVYKSNSRLQQSAAPPRSLATSSTAPNSATPHRAAPLPHKEYLQTGSGCKARSITSRHNNSSSASSHSSSTETTTTMTNNQKSSSGTSSLLGVNGGGSAMTHSSANTFRMAPHSSTGADYNENPFNNTNVNANGEEAAEMMDVVPEIIVVRTRNSSMDTNDTTPNSSRKVSLQSHRRISRRYSSMDEFKRKKSMFGNSGSSGSRPKRWKAGSLMFSRFSFRRPK